MVGFQHKFKRGEAREFPLRPSSFPPFTCEHKITLLSGCITVFNRYVMYGLVVLLKAPHVIVRQVIGD